MNIKPIIKVERDAFVIGTVGLWSKVGGGRVAPGEEAQAEDRLPQNHAWWVLLQS